MYRGTAASPNRHLMRLHLVRVVLPCSMLALLVGVAHGQTPASVVIESGGSLTIRSSGHLDIGAPQATADATSTDSPLAPPPSSSPSPPTPPSLPPSSPNIVGFMNTYLNGRCHDASNQMYDAAQYTLSEEACRTMCLQYTHCPGVSWWVSTDPTSACSVHFQNNQYTTADFPGASWVTTNNPGTGPVTLSSGHTSIHCWRRT